MTSPAPIDTTRTIEIDSSPSAMAMLVLLGALMTAAGGLLAFRILPDIEPGGVGQAVGYAALIFFGFCTAIGVQRMLSKVATVITITPQGIRDTRVAADFIPWKSVTGISTWSFMGQQAMVLAVEPEIESKLALTRMARSTRSANRSLGADGLCVTAQGLKIDYPTLYNTSLAYAAAARRIA